ncbi:MAG: glutathione S-transferase N-terminal domain-containing protein [Acetobacteraceae bacterium]|nr:glutathione S-transferase N-terminal domain-containing protein [Acetobacteraceae bacterium]MBV8522445.1 glutathione S-transferase N-terminal domain-containing protein [Acetobacteraceae bacterium]
MKLFYSATSPFVRKVMACAITRGIDGQIERLSVNPHLSPPELLAHNPLSKVPCLVTDDGLALFDSPVICEYLDSIGDAQPLFPEHGVTRWRALKQQAIGDGILDAAVLRRMEQGRPREAARDAVIERQRQAVGRSLDVLEADIPHRGTDIGSITIACALGYLDFRFAEDTWRATRPQLAHWFDVLAQEPGIAHTAPRDRS